MANATTSSEPRQEQENQPPQEQEPRGLARSWSIVTVFASEPTMAWHRLPGLRLHSHTSLALGGLAGAVGATAAVAPILTVIDLSIARAAVDPKLGGLLGALRHTVTDLRGGRLAFFQPLKLMTVVYFGTYIVANETHVTCTNLGIDYKAPTALAAGAFNVAAIAWKDSNFYKIFGPPKKFPPASYGLMAVRDGLTITSSFVFKNQLMEHMEAQGMHHRTADLLSSLTVPLAAQLVSTPLHIIAMDLPKRPTASVWSRMAAVAAGYTSVLTGRAMRILPAFSVGTYINDVVKESFFEYNNVPYEK